MTDHTVDETMLSHADWSISDRASMLFRRLADQVGDAEAEEVLSWAWHLGWLTGFDDHGRDRATTPDTTPDPFRNHKES